MFPSLILPSRLIELESDRLLVSADLGALFDLNGHTLTANLLSTGFGTAWVMGPGTVDGEVEITVADGKFIALTFTATSVAVFASGNAGDIPLLANVQELTNPQKAQVQENLSLVPGTDIATPAQTDAKIAAYHLDLDAPPISHNTRPLIVNGTLIDFFGIAIPTPVTLLSTGFNQWGLTVGDTNWYAGRGYDNSDDPYVEFYNASDDLAYYATGSNGAEFDAAPLVVAIGGSSTGNATVTYGAATLAPPGSTATENGNVWKNVGTAEEPEWVKILNESQTAALLTPKANLTGGNTFSGTQANTGEVRSSASLGTNPTQLLSQENFLELAFLRQPSVFSLGVASRTNTARASATLGAGVIFLSAGDAASQVGDNAAAAWDYFLNVRGSGANSRFNTPFRLMLETNSNITNGHALVVRAGACDSVGMLTGRGIALRCEGGTNIVTLQVHDGTSLFTATGTIPLFLRARIVMQWDGSTTLRVFAETITSGGAITTMALISTLTLAADIGGVPGSARDLVVENRIITALTSTRTVNLNTVTFNNH
jgi:hypothetical protein